MRHANKSYYSSKGKRIYSDFSTFAQGRTLARCNAMEFCRNFSRHGAPVVVCEYGVGKGDFARNFLDGVKKLDKRLYAKTRYYLFDFSEKMLSAARSNLSAHKAVCIFGKFDAAADRPDLAFDYCRINELFTDLPADFYMKDEGSVLKLEPVKGGAFSTSAAPSHLPVVSAFLSRIGEGRIIPFNNCAEKFLLSLCACGKSGFRIDVFDYGFYTPDDLLLHPVDEWNRLMVRNYSGQLTTDLNFLHLLSSLAAAGVPAKIGAQKAYCERVLGCRLALSETPRGLDYARLKKESGIEEDDGFYHLRIGR